MLASRGPSRASFVGSRRSVEHAFVRLYLLPILYVSLLLLVMMVAGVRECSCAYQPREIAYALTTACASVSQSNLPFGWLGASTLAPVDQTPPGVVGGTVTDEIKCVATLISPKN